MDSLSKGDDCPVPLAICWNVCYAIKGYAKQCLFSLVTGNINSIMACIISAILIGKGTFVEKKGDMNSRLCWLAVDVEPSLNGCHLGTDDDHKNGSCEETNYNYKGKEKC